MNGSSVLGILGLLFVSAAVAGPSGAVPVTVGSLPAGCVLDGSHSLPPGLEATPAPLLPVYPNHPGWPVSVPGGISPPVCADLDPAYPGLEVAMGTLSSGTNLYVFHADGTPVSGFPIDIGFFVASSPSIGDLDGDGGLEIVAGDFGSNQVWAVDAHGVALPGWPVAVRANVRSTAALADLDPAFPGLEIVIGVQDGQVYAWHYDGTPVPGWPVSAGNFVERCSPAIGDVDGDGNLEVFVGSWYDGQTGSTGGVYGFDHDGTTLPGWPQLANHVSVIASPALADLDGDGNLEIITGTYETVARMCVWHHDGTAMSGWPYAIPRGSSSTSAVTSSPAVCDLDGDGALEIVDGTCGQCGTMYAWRRDGTVLSGWPAFTNCVVDGSSPAIGDVDGDGQLEIVVGSGSGFTPYGCTVQISKAYIYRRDGTVLSGWPVDLGTATIPSPALADADGDGSVEIFMAFANLAWCWDAPGAYAADRTPWPYFHLGIDHTGNFAAPDPASTGEPVTDGIARLLVRPNPVSTGPVSFRLPDGRPAQRVDVYAPSGSLVRRVQEGSWDGRDGAGNPVPGGIYFLRNGGDEGPGVRLVVLR